MRNPVPIPKHRTRQASATEPRGKRITLVGGGVIGSHAALLVARLPGVTQVRLIDGDTYAESNLCCQAITPADVGHPKVEVLARKLRRQAPNIAVEPIFNWVERVPRGLLRGDVVLACVDSRRARCVVNEVCWRLGIPLIDAGVDGAGMLARTNIYQPGPGCPCLECSWEAADYAAIEQVYACEKGAGSPPATNAPASLGSIAAGLLVGECQRLLAGDLDPVARGRQVLWDCRNHRCLVTRYRVNPGCRFDHAVWSIERQRVSVHELTVGLFLDLLRGGAGAPPVAIRVAGQQFVTRLACAACGVTCADCLSLDRALTPARLRCPQCDALMSVSGFHALEWLDTDALRESQTRLSLARVGLRPRDVVTVRQADRVRHIELVELTGGEAESGAGVRQAEQLLGRHTVPHGDVEGGEG